MNKLYKNIMLFGLIVVSMSFANIKGLGGVRVVTGNDVGSFALNENSKGRTAIEDKYYNTNDNETIKKRSHKRRRKVRRPREGR